ncbi:adenylate kinase [Nitratireductor soli]|uniref:adenylate kinase n=1 Tax=Nitratireductor soli TaxID=1670619 RepID=UPI000B1E06C0|nr:adenylate kinase [Nitratireductor soli]
MPHYEIDRLYWQPDWSTTPGHIYEKQHAEIIGKDDWIIDGGGNLATIRARIERATELILIDMPLWVHFWLAAERQISWAAGALEHPPAGNTNVPETGRLFEIIWQVDRDWMPTLRTLCDDQEAKGKVVTRLNSLDELDAFARCE